MVFEIIWSDSAVKQLKKLDRTIARRIFAKVGDLHESPFPMSEDSLARLIIARE